MTTWTLLTNHFRVLLSIRRDPEARLRDIAAGLEITERRVYGIVSDLTQAGYIVKHKDGRRNRYEVREQLPIPDALGRGRSVGELLRLLSHS